MNNLKILLGGGSGRDVFSVTIFHLKVYLLWKKMYYLWGKNTFRLHVGRKMKSMRTLHVCLQLCNQLANGALYLDFCLGLDGESQWLTQNPGNEFLCNL